MISVMHLNGDDMKKIKYPPLKREWFVCPVCGTKLIIYDNTAVLSGGEYIKCRTCKNEIEIKK
mgnify:CR=1 FL=1